MFYIFYEILKTKGQWCGKGLHVMTSSCIVPHGPLARCINLRVLHVSGEPGTFAPPQQVSDPDMHYGTCVTHVPWCMSESLTSGFLWSRWRGKRPRHSRRIRNSQFTYLVRGPLIMYYSTYTCDNKQWLIQGGICSLLYLPADEFTTLVSIWRMIRICNARSRDSIILIYSVGTRWF